MGFALAPLLYTLGMGDWREFSAALELVWSMISKLRTGFRKQKELKRQHSVVAGNLHIVEGLIFDVQPPWLLTCLSCCVVLQSL